MSKGRNKATIRKELQLLRELACSYAEVLVFHENPEAVCGRRPIIPHARELNRRIREAQERLLILGYHIPNSWLEIDTFGELRPAGLRRRGPSKARDALRYWARYVTRHGARYSPPDLAPVKNVLTKMSVRSLRLHAELARAEESGDAGADDDRGDPVSLLEFLNEYSVRELTGEKAKSHKSRIGTAKRRKKIVLPKPVRKVTRGKTPRYYPADLYRRWPKYQKAVSGLPDLKPRP